MPGFRQDLGQIDHLVLRQTSGLAIPVQGLKAVRRDPEALLVKGTQPELGPGVTLGGGLAIPLGRQGIIRSTTQTPFVDLADIGLRGRVTLFRGDLPDGQGRVKVGAIEENVLSAEDLTVTDGLLDRSGTVHPGQGLPHLAHAPGQQAIDDGEVFNTADHIFSGPGRVGGAGGPGGEAAPIGRLTLRRAAPRDQGQGRRQEHRKDPNPGSPDRYKLI